MKNVLEIFGHIAEKENLKIGTLEKSIGASKGVLSRAMKNGSDVQSKWFLALVEKYPQYNYGKMLKGEDSSDYHGVLEEPNENYVVKSEEFISLKKDLKILHDGLVENFSSISDGIVHLLKNSQEVKRFINSLDANSINKASCGINEFLEEHE